MDNPLLVVPGQVWKRNPSELEKTVKEVDGKNVYLNFYGGYGLESFLESHSIVKNSTPKVGEIWRTPFGGNRRITEIENGRVWGCLEDSDFPTWNFIDAYTNNVDQYWIVETTKESDNQMTLDFEAATVIDLISWCLDKAKNTCVTEEQKRSFVDKVLYETKSDSTGQEAAKAVLSVARRVLTPSQWADAIKVFKNAGFSFDPIYQFRLAGRGDLVWIEIEGYNNPTHRKSMHYMKEVGAANMTVHIGSASYDYRRVN